MIDRLMFFFLEREDEREKKRVSHDFLNRRRGRRLHRKNNAERDSEG